ncbi:sulfotransferase family 2 domain-containing protein [Dyella sp. S184]|uniref:sulfotransferase family 2 domain-containing protein n=1 Tax=Dyella sp. S184 TaxID=1641862 RepID=UPI00131DB1EC|nr:sulfotransferase family 2 domain-containing protein [Dyella sp. S184]
MTIISLHLPKTAGTSFGSSLASHFGDRYRRDYADQGICKPMAQRCEAALAAGVEIAAQGLGDIECVHGHFLPVKYLPLAATRELTFVTWMRDPVTRMISHYYYWQESYDEKASAPHHRQVIEESWTLEQFCLSERFRNIYTQYLWNFPLDNFAFIGISEHYQEDLQEFCRRYLSTSLEPRSRNTTKYSGLRQAPDTAFLDKVREFHAADMELYQRALTWRARSIGAREGQAANVVDGVGIRSSVNRLQSLPEVLAGSMEPLVPIMRSVE